MTARALLLPLLVISVHCSVPYPAPAAQKPNLLVIITDQQHAGMLSCAGNSYVKTPAMDGLAARGVRFERAYCANPVCVPSRFSMLSGVLPSRIGMENNNGMKLKVPEEVLAHTMGRVIRAAGYETVYGGKLHTPMTLAQMEFDNLTNDQRSELADQCVEFLGRKHDKPFLLVASFINPHDICYMAIQDFARSTKRRDVTLERAGAAMGALTEAMKLPEGMSRETFFATVCPPLPANFEVPANEPESILDMSQTNFRVYARKSWSAEQWRLHRWAYARLTERVDAEIGKVLAALRTNGLEENTVVVFTSDHGDMDSAHRLEHKSTLYEEATHVPFIVAAAGVRQPGRVDRAHFVSSGLDLIPTLCDFAGTPIPKALSGRSVRPLVEKGEAQGWRTELVVETGRGRLLRTERYKYMAYSEGKPREQLVDLEKDPGEMQSLAADPAALPILKQHRELLRQWYQANQEKLSPEYVIGQ